MRGGNTSNWVENTSPIALKLGVDFVHINLQLLRCGLVWSGVVPLRRPGRMEIQVLRPCVLSVRPFKGIAFDVGGRCMPLALCYGGQGN